MPELQRISARVRHRPISPFITAQESGQETTITPLACNEMKRANDGVVAESEIIIRGTEILAKFCSRHGSFVMRACLKRQGLSFECLGTWKGPPLNPT